MPSSICLEPLSQTLTAVPSWLGPTLAAATILVVAVRALVWSTIVLVGLLTRNDKRAERALQILECVWSSRQKRSR
jgi:uncharacterized SAM-binding protein YcdF (DUF218 family)